MDAPAGTSEDGARAPFGVGTALRAGFSAWRRRFGMLLAVAGIVAAVNAPIQALQRATAAGADAAAARAEARGGREPTPEEALEDLQAIVPACCGSCGALVLGLAFAAPVMAGAAVAGARAVRGNGRVSDAFAAFRPGRYAPTLAATVVTALIGGGAAVLLAMVQAIALAGAASRALGSIASPAAIGTVAAGLAALTLWLSARLWFALIRAADPERPRVSGMGAVGRSWQWTEGRAQWAVLALVLVLGALTALLMLPSILLAPGGPPAAEAAPGVRGAVAWVAVVTGAVVAVTAWTAVLGAAYELLADDREPRCAVGERAPPDGGAGMSA